MLSIIIPSYNEEQRIGKTLLLLKKWLAKNQAIVPSYEMIVADDGADRTAKIVSELAQNWAALRLLKFPVRAGKGGAISKALEVARGDALVYDADAATSPEFIATALRAIDAEGAGIVCGSRELPDSRRVGKIGLERRLATKAFNFFVNLLFGLDCTDSQCGFKLLRKSAYKKLLPFSHPWYEWDVELLAKAKKAGFKVVEIPIEWRAVEGGKMKKRYTLGMVLGVLGLKMELLLADLQPVVNASGRARA